MLITNKIEYKINNKSEIYFYKKLGYDVNFIGDIFFLNIKDLPYSNKTKIEALCDICGKVKQISYKQYNLTTKRSAIEYCCSQKCSRDKNKKTLLARYGVDNISKLDKIKEQKIKTCQINYGVDYPQQSIDIFNKSKDTKFIKYNNVNYSNIQQMIKTKFDNLKEKFLADSYYLSKNIIDYKGNGIFVFKCDKGHVYQINYQLIKLREEKNSIICTECNPLNSSSGMENSLVEFIEENYNGEIILNDKKTIFPLELDIFLPKLNLAFEFNGLYWHSEIYKSPDYHVNKTNLCREKGIHLIHVWEDDWIYKNDIIKSIILNKLLINDNRIYARKCDIIIINDNKVVQNFLNENHIQGYITSKIKLCLVHENEIVSLMTFGSLRKSLNSKNIDGHYELIRFCNKKYTNVIGGADKLFKFFIKNYKPNEIISYSDYSKYDGNMYIKLGFKYKSTSNPGYYYIHSGKRLHRYNFRKELLIKQGFDKSKTELEIMHQRGYYRVFDCGVQKWVYKNEQF